MSSRKKRSALSGRRGRERGVSRFYPAFLALLLSACCPLLLSADDKWGGVDESVIEKYAEEHGRTASAPLINTDQGDLLLFVFLLAGAAGGFAAGYYWRQLTAESGQVRDPQAKDAAEGVK